MPGLSGIRVNRVSQSHAITMSGCIKELHPLLANEKDKKRPRAAAQESSDERWWREKEETRRVTVFMTLYLQHIGVRTMKRCSADNE
jgi:hypothetical protein